MAYLTATVVAVAGGIGTGKTTACRNLSAVLGWPVARYSDVLRDVAARRGMPAERAVLQDIGAELAANWPEFTRALLARAGWQPGQPLIVDGLRHAEAARALRQAIKAPLLIAFLDAPGTGLARARLRDGNLSDDAEHHPAEADLPGLHQHASLTLDTSQMSPSAVTSAILAALLLPRDTEPQH